MTFTAKRVPSVGFYKNKDKNGNEYLSATLNEERFKQLMKELTANSRLTLITNTFKDNETKPDFVLKIAEKQQTSQANAPRVQQATSRESSDDL